MINETSSENETQKPTVTVGDTEQSSTVSSAETKIESNQHIQVKVVDDKSVNTNQEAQPANDDSISGFQQHTEQQVQQQQLSQQPPVMQKTETQLMPKSEKSDQSEGKVVETQPQVIMPDVDLVNLSEIKQEETKPGLIILQWLTYVFWGWTIVAVSYLVVATLSHYMDLFEFGDAVYYGIAASVTLLPVSLICDYFYLNKETSEKSTFSSVVMAFHAVACGLFAIGALVTAAFSAVNLMIGGTETESNKLTIYCSVIISALWAILLLRIAASGKMFNQRKSSAILLALLCGVIIALGIIGPGVEAKRTRQDKMIEANLEQVQGGVNYYVSSNDDLPGNLSEIELEGDAKKIVDDNLVTYKNDGMDIESGYDVVYKYQLCVNYVEKSSNPYTNSFLPDNNDDGYSTYLSTYSHPKGEVCYKLKTTSYYFEATDYEN